MVSQYIVTYPIMDFCLAVEQRPEMRVLRRWWYQPALDILEIRAAHAAVNMEEETETEDSEGERDYDTEHKKEV